jgi:hypothetical protein
MPGRVLGKVLVRTSKTGKLFVESQDNLRSGEFRAFLYSVDKEYAQTHDDVYRGNDPKYQSVDSYNNPVAHAASKARFRASRRGSKFHFSLGTEAFDRRSAARDIYGSIGFRPDTGSKLLAFELINRYSSFLGSLKTTSSIEEKVQSILEYNPSIYMITSSDGTPRYFVPNESNGKNRWENFIGDQTIIAVKGAKKKEDAYE